MASVMLSLTYMDVVLPAYAFGKPVAAVHTRAAEPLPPPVFKLLPAAGMNGGSSVAAVAKVDGGPTLPEVESFHSVSNDKMVDLFSGDFHYSIPLIDVGGYPIAIGYNSGISMDQEASWTGLGWNLNPGAIVRNVRGLPDEFNGTDSVTKTMSVKDNITIGGDGSIGIKLVNFPIKITGNINLGLFYNNYRGWGMESGVKASVRVADKAAGRLTAGLGITNNTQEGLSFNPGIDMQFFTNEQKDKGGFGGNLNLGTSLSTRAGMKSVQFSAGLNQMKAFEKIRLNTGNVSGSISFAYPSFMPTISMPYTNEAFTGSFGLGFEMSTMYPNFGTSGYYSRQYIAAKDTLQSIPAYGYLNMYSGGLRDRSLLDYNREREIPVQESIRNIAIPAYTYDIFSVSGEGTGGMFRAYRNDIGYVYDHQMRTNSISTSAGLDLGFGNLFHVGGDFTRIYASTSTGPWRYNPLARAIAFTKPDKDYEAAYFRNPAEMGVNDKDFYDRIGGDDIVLPELTGDQTRSMSTSGNLLRYRGGKVIGKLPLNAANSHKATRDKRTQVISYLNADEASNAGFSKYIENYGLNQYVLSTCSQPFPKEEGERGLLGAMYSNSNPDPSLYNFTKVFRNINFNNVKEFISNNGFGDSFLPNPRNDEHGSYFSVFWTGRLKAPVTGIYKIITQVDDGVRLFINDANFIDKYHDSERTYDTSYVNLEAGKMYKVRIDYYNGPGDGMLSMDWVCNNTHVTMNDFYLPEKLDTFNVIPGKLSLEKRVNNFRKPHHISEVDVLNADGQRYIYGLPVYNHLQRESTFSLEQTDGDPVTGTASYQDGIDNSTKNNKGNEHYYSSEVTPPYAHTYLLTNIVSPDYIDLTGDGITDDDPGNAIKFNYSKVAGKGYLYKWRTPYSNKAAYNEGLKTDKRDDRGSYVYGEKELWYLNSIVSKNMIATFKVSDRADLRPINESGVKETDSHLPKKLDEINLYTKADFLKYGDKATPVKTVHFDYTYELCRGVNGAAQDLGKLTLKRIWFSYNGNVSRNPDRARQNAYVFYYNKNNPGYSHHSFDRWGNYKDAAQNPASSGNNIMTNAEYPYALQDSAMAAANAAAWTLDSIKLPSGGRMKINYESDDYAFVQNRRAARMMQIAGFSAARPTSLADVSPGLYNNITGAEHIYVSINVPKKVASKAEVFGNYLDGLHDTLFFRLNVKMPADQYGRGAEYVPCYALLDNTDYGFYNNGNTIYIKVVPVALNGDAGGRFSPLTHAALQFLKRHLPSKAYPLSEVDDLTGEAAIRMVFSLAATIPTELAGFPQTARQRAYARDVNLERSFVRLDDPFYKKYGGGLRVKNILIYDHWNSMTGQKESLYGTDYKYTTTKMINGVETEISSGVAAYEPIPGGEENPWHTPLVYKEKTGKLVPDVASYVETPLGESFFPAPSVGYSKVQTRSINAKNVRSANGYEETCFYTTYDFPTLVSFSEFDGSSRLHYKPKGLMSILGVDVVYHLAMSQGFRIELNDMNGRMKSHKIFAEGSTPIATTTNYYHVDNEQVEQKHLRNVVMAINRQGVIDSSAVIGMDMELMADMRQQLAGANGITTNGGVDIFWGTPVSTAFGLVVIPQSDDKAFRSAAITKVINRHGILDSVIVTDKGSRVATYNLLYDSETGSPLLTATQNEYGDSVFNFNYPAAWVYDGMSGAYKNINTTLEHVNIKAGRIISDLSPATANTYFASGDEILIYSHIQVDTVACNPAVATFPGTAKVWAVDANVLNGGTPDIYFMNQDGSPVTGNNVTMKIIRSGRRNMNTSAGSVTMLKNPLVKRNGSYVLEIDKNKQVINASMVEYKQNWHIEDTKKQTYNCVYQ